MIIQVNQMMIILIIQSKLQIRLNKYVIGWNKANNLKVWHIYRIIMYINCYKFYIKKYNRQPSQLQIIIVYGYKKCNNLQDYIK